MPVKVLLLGYGLVAVHFHVGVERIKLGEVEPYGVPLARYKMSHRVEDIEVVGAVDVDVGKVGRTAYEVARESIGDSVPVPRSLRDVEISMGLHMGSLRGLPMRAEGLEERLGLGGGLARFAEYLDSVKPDVVMNVITTENASPFNNVAALRDSVGRGSSSASQTYAYAVATWGRGTAFVNVIPTPLARDQAFVDLFSGAGSLVLGDDGATGATPLTADILEHLAERNRRVLSIAQFNIGGNTDFLALTIPERNAMKESTKASVVEDILGYDVPHYIKPTGYLGPLGDRKFVSMHISWRTFNGLEDEMVVNLRINDSPALAGLLVDLARIGRALVEREHYGTAYPVNAFFMKSPGPPGSRNVARVLAYEMLVKWLMQIGVIH